MLELESVLRQQSREELVQRTQSCFETGIATKACGVGRRVDMNYDLEVPSLGADAIEIVGQACKTAHCVIAKVVGDSVKTFHEVV